MKRCFALGVAFLLLAGFSTLIVAEANGQCCGTTGWSSPAMNCAPAYCNNTYTARPVFAGRLRGRLVARNNAYCSTPCYTTVTPAPTYVGTVNCGGCATGCASCCQPAPIVASNCCNMCGTAGCYGDCRVARTRIFPLRSRAMYTSTCCPTTCDTYGTAYGTAGCASGCGTVISGEAPAPASGAVVQPPTDATPPSPDDT